MKHEFFLLIILGPLFYNIASYASEDPFLYQVPEETEIADLRDSYTVGTELVINEHDFEFDQEEPNSVPEESVQEEIESAKKKSRNENNARAAARSRAGNNATLTVIAEHFKVSVGELKAKTPPAILQAINKKEWTGSLRQQRINKAQKRIRAREVHARSLLLVKFNKLSQAVKNDLNEKISQRKEELFQKYLRRKKERNQTNS